MGKGKRRGDCEMRRVRKDIYPYRLMVEADHICAPGITWTTVRQIRDFQSYVYNHHKNFVKGLSEGRLVKLVQASIRDN
jgi:hypothetical protein